jgi:hypothetical protein
VGGSPILVRLNGERRARLSQLGLKRALTHSDYKQALSACGEWQALSPTERSRHLRAWRRVYAARLHEQTGRWKHRELDWHIFSFQFAKALNGEEAMDAYACDMPVDLLIIPESLRLEAVRVRAMALPIFRAFREDVIIFPESLDWTMAFTHEESLGLGPYFSRREWM